MKVCETCGKELKFFDVYTTNGIVQCEECAMKTLSEKSKKRGNTSTLDNKDLVEQLNNNSKENTTTTESEVKPIINQVVSDTDRIINENGKLNDSSFWIGFLKTAAKIEFVISIIAGIVGAFAIGIDYWYFEGFLIGIAVLLGSVIVSIIVFATEMVFLNLAEDVSVIRKTLTKNQKDK